MLYVGVDQHRKQLTVSVRNEAGDVILRRQVSTEWERVRLFWREIAERSQPDGGYVVILEVCGFNDWLLKLLDESGCREIVLVQSRERAKTKTDRRDAHRLGELLWVNRQRLLRGQRVEGMKRVRPPSASQAADRQLTALRQRIVAQRTQTINRVQHLLLKHNLGQECPTKGLQTAKARHWLKRLVVPAMDRLELDQLLEHWELLERQRVTVDSRIREHQQRDPQACVLATVPGASAYSSLALSARLGDASRFTTPGSLPNFWGLVPRCRNSGEVTDRLGSITKEGSAVARFILGQLVLHVLKRDAWMRGWYRKIKARRGSKIARVAVMRRLTVVIWNMVRYQQPYCCGGSEAVRRQRELQKARSPAESPTSSLPA